MLYFLFFSLQTQISSALWDIEIEKCDEWRWLKPIDYKISGVISQCEYELWVNKIEEIKRQLVEVWQSSNTTFEWKMRFSCFRVFRVVQDGAVGKTGMQIIF